MAGIHQAPPRLGGAPRNKGKGTNEPIRFLPVLPSKRSKPEWQDNPPSFLLSGQADEEEPNTIDLIGELTSKDQVKRKKPKRLKPLEATGQQNGPLDAFKQPKKDRESFRKSLVDIILEDDKGVKPTTSTVHEELPSTSRAGSPTAAEKDILRYYYYIHNGIDTEHVAPMEDSWLENVLSLVPNTLKKGHSETIDSLSDEMREDYLMSVKKAIVDFVLRDPRHVEEEVKETLPHRVEMAVVPKPWNRSFLAAKEATALALHNINPCMMQVLTLWHTSFGDLRFIDVEDFHNRKESMELKTFQNMCMKHIEAAKETLLKKWFPEVQTIFYQGNKRKQVPSNKEHEKLVSFFNCAATLMTDNLQQLTLNSISDYTDLLCQPPTSTRAFEHSGFVLRMILDDTQIKFEPHFEDFEVVLLNVYDVIVKAAGVVPRVETKLYSEWQKSKAKAYLKPVVLEGIMKRHKQEVADMLKKESVRPIEHSKMYDKYDFLITRQADTDVDQFMADDKHTFEEYRQEMLKYHDLVEEISYNSEKQVIVVRVGMFEVHCDELIRALAKRSDNLRSKLLNKMCNDHQEENKK
ncbi:dynein axonemal heavy chain 7-like [Babylonia areolata]|uniref:dynein axonemal heavy chain 7-like n=1 Tax=Babylonia areolata TaxID=304850 RepID=UPI003FCF26FB